MSGASPRPRSDGRPLRALWVSHFPVFGGPHNIVLRLARPLAELGVESTMLLPAEPGTAAERLRAQHVPVIQIPLSRLRASSDVRLHGRLVAGFVGDVRRIRRLIRERGFDVVVLTGLANPHAALAARDSAAALVWQILDTSTPRPLVHAMMPLVRSLADAAMFNGHTLVDMHTGGRPLDIPVSIFTGPVDTDQFRPDRQRGRLWRQRMGIPLDAPLVGTVANFNPMKGLEWFIRAAGLIFRERPDAWFLMSGASYATHRGYSNRLAHERLVSGVPAERWVITHETPEDHYRALDVKLITSLPRSEGRTTTGPEAMACAVPVVTADVGAVSEVVIHELAGLVVPPLDPQALAQATLRLLEDDELRRQMGAEGRRLAVERYGLRPSAALFRDVFADARAHHGARAGRRS